MLLSHTGHSFSAAGAAGAGGIGFFLLKEPVSKRDGPFLSAPNVVVVVVVVVVVGAPNEKSGLSDPAEDPNVVGVVAAPNEKRGVSETTAALGDSVALFFLFTLETSSGLSSPNTAKVDLVPSLEVLGKLVVNVIVDVEANEEGVKDEVVNDEVAGEVVSEVNNGVVNGAVNVEANGVSGALTTFGSLKVLPPSRFFLGKGTVSKSASSSSPFVAVYTSFLIIVLSFLVSSTAFSDFFSSTIVFSFTFFFFGASCLLSSSR